MAIAAFSVSMTVLNIVLNTINSIEDKTHQVFELQKILSEIQLSFDECSATLMLWNATWAREEMTEEAYLELFGVEGWPLIKSTKQLVEELLDGVHGALCLTDRNKSIGPEEDAASQATSRFSILTSRLTRRGVNLVKKAKTLSVPKFLGKKEKRPVRETDGGNLPEAPLADVPEGLTLREFEEWVEFTASLSKFQSRPKPDPSIIRRISGIIIRNQRLDRKVARMKEAVNKLNSLVKIYSEGRGNENVEIFLDNYDFSLFARNFSHQILQYDNRPPNSGWYLQLNFTDDEKDCKLLLEEIVRQCKFCFATYTDNPGQNGMFKNEVKLLPAGGTLRPNREITKFLRKTLAELFMSDEGYIEFLESRSYQLKAFEEPLLWTQDWRTLLEAGVQTPQVRKAFELARARLALGFTIWMLLLWHDDWFSHICSCSLRCVFFPQKQGQEGHDAKASQKSYSLENLYFPVKRIEDGVDEITQDHNKGDQVVTKVERENANEVRTQPAAVQVAAQGRSCTRQSPPGEKLHLFGILLAELLLAQPIELDADLRPTGNLTTVTDIYWRVHEDVSPNAASAVHFCFHNAGKSRWDSRRSELVNKQRAELIKNVLNPVSKHYEGVRSHCEAQSEHVDKIFDVARNHADAGFA